MPNQGLIERLDALLKKKAGPDGKLSDRKASMNAGLHVEAIRNIRRGWEPKSDVIYGLAAYFGVPPEHFTDALIKGGPERTERVRLTRVTVRGDVQAGVWREAIEWEGSEWYSITVPESDRFPRIERFGLVVKGNSMNLRYPEGTTVVVVRFGDIARGPESGERVVCLRRSKTGEYEATIKEYELDDRGRHILWPRSTDPEFQTPFILSGDRLPISADYEEFPPTVRATTYEDVSAPDIVIAGLVIQSVRDE